MLYVMGHQFVQYHIRRVIPTKLPSAGISEGIVRSQAASVKAQASLGCDLK